MKREKGFTIQELTIVVALLLIFTAILLPKYQQAIAPSEDNSYRRVGNCMAWNQHGYAHYHCFKPGEVPWQT